MTDQRRGGSTRGDEAPAPGYRGALPPRNDSLAKPWILLVVAIFVLIFVLAFAKVPSRIFPEPTATLVPSPSAAPSGSGTASGSGSPSSSGSPSASATPSASHTPSVSATP
jgi:hypothetical protein